MIWGGSLAWPILLIKPYIQVGFFPSLTVAQLIEFFLARAILAFGLGALSAAFYEAMIARHFSKEKRPNRHHLFYLSVGPLIFLVLFLLFNLPFASSLLLAILTNIIIVIVIRCDLIWDVTFSGLFFAALYGTIFITAFNNIPGNIDRLWFTDTISGITIFGLPIEELIVACLFGVLWGPLYIALKGVKERDET